MQTAIVEVMTKNERRVFLLDFEKPLYELEEKINQIRELARKKM